MGGRLPRERYAGRIGPHHGVCPYLADAGLGLDRLEHAMRLAQRDRDGVVSDLAATPAWLRNEVLRSGSQVACGAAAVLVEERATSRVLEDTTARRAVPTAPDQKRVQHRPELATGRCELVDMPPGVLWVLPPL